MLPPVLPFRGEKMDITLSGVPASTAQATAQSAMSLERRQSMDGKGADPKSDDKSPGGVAMTESLEAAVSSVNSFVQTIRRDLNFDLDDSSGKMVVRVTDGATGNVVRQIPTEDALRLAENLEQARSLLFKAQA